MVSHLTPVPISFSKPFLALSSNKQSEPLLVPLPVWLIDASLSGETKWTISGQHTGRTDIPLTELGERQVTATGAVLVGKGKLLDPAKVKKVWVSPRRRALRTFELLFAGEKVEADESDGSDLVGVDELIFGGGKGSVLVTEEIREWDYGEYEGMMAEDVRELRRMQGLDADGKRWNVWRDGCVGGE